MDDIEVYIFLRIQCKLISVVFSREFVTGALGESSSL